MEKEAIASEQSGTGTVEESNDEVSILSAGHDAEGLNLYEEVSQETAGEELVDAVVSGCDETGAGDPNSQEDQEVQEGVSPEISAGTGEESYEATASADDSPQQDPEGLTQTQNQKEQAIRSGARGQSAEESHSVFRPRLAKLSATNRSLEVAPVTRADRPTSGYASSQEGSPRVQAGSATRIRSARDRSPSKAARAGHPSNLTPLISSKVFSPGPGAYTPAMDRFGHIDGAKQFSFGSARQRPWHVCIRDNILSPGPAYLPGRDFSSTLSAPPQNLFGRRDLGTRYSLNANMPSNCPHWNPGPGDYKAASIYKGGSVEPGIDVPKAVFGNSAKLVSPESRFSGTVFISNEHAMHENVSVQSPGPCIYSPKLDMVKQASSSYTMLKKAPSYFDSYFDPSRQTSPGPVYFSSHMDNRGTKIWGDDPKATFGRAGKLNEPEVSVNSSAFISKLHAMHCNQSVHSPGPVYYPDMPQPRQSVPHLSSGPTDRFYNRLELGRLA